MVHTHQIAPTRFVEANGIRLAYRRFGKAGGVPLVFNQHFTGTMDHWDPAVTDGFAKDREVVLFNNAGVSSSSGQVPTSIEGMAANAIAFIGALGLSKTDVLGFSIGGFVAQRIADQAPGLVRKLVLVGTGPRGGEGMASLTPEAQQIFGASYQEPDRLWLAVHFTRSEASQAAGRGFLKRFRLRKENRDPEVNEKVAPAQLEALVKWGIQFDKAYDYLKSIRQPTLVVNGGNDVIVYSVNSFILQQHLPNAQLILYPDANHGSQYQYPELFVRHVSMFLSADERRGVGGSKAGTFRHSNNRTMIMATLTGKTALVTGASRGIGRAGALALAAAGAQVLVHYGRGAKEADDVVAEITEAGGRADAIAADLAAADGASKLARQARSIVGDRLDILVANAGVLKVATIEETTVEDFDRLFAINVRTPFFLVQQLLPIMCKGSSIVFLSSLAARAVVGTEPAYAATKGAVDTLVKHFASTLGARGIRVNAVAPGVVETDMLNFTKTDGRRDVALGMQALKRLAQPDDIGGVVAFLASEDARWISGDTIHVDGGSKL